MVTSEKGRPFSTFPVCVNALIVNEAGELLLLSSPHRNGVNEWQTVSGGLDAGETILAGTLREVREELGSQVSVEPLGVIHTHTFHFDSQVRFMVGTYYLLAYLGGKIVPGDDMVDSEYRWWSLDVLLSGAAKLHVSTDHPWLLKRAVALGRQWGKRPFQDVVLQKPLNESNR